MIWGNLISSSAIRLMSKPKLSWRLRCARFEPASRCSQVQTDSTITSVADSTNFRTAVTTGGVALFEIGKGQDAAVSKLASGINSPSSQHRDLQASSAH
jgi:hypothetical protein